MTRHSGSAALAAFVTFGLFYLMNALSSIGTEPKPTEPDPPIPIAWAEEDPIQPPPCRCMPEPPMVPPPVDPANVTAIQVTSWSPPEDSGPARPIGPIGFHTPRVEVAPDDSDSIRIYCPSPAYPTHRAALKGGWVHVGFDVDASGRTSNVRVLDSEPRRVFDRAAVNAAAGCRYHPKRVDGKATIDPDVSFVFRFETDREPERATTPNQEETR